MHLSLLKDRGLMLVYITPAAALCSPACVHAMPHIAYHIRRGIPAKGGWGMAACRCTQFSAAKSEVIAVPVEKPSLGPLPPTQLSWPHGAVHGLRRKGTTWQAQQWCTGLGPHALINTQRTTQRNLQVRARRRRQTPGVMLRMQAMNPMNPFVAQFSTALFRRECCQLLMA